MAYQIGNIIRASDYNAFVNQVSDIYGVGNGDRGYGETAIPLSTVNAGDVIASTEWTNLRNAIEVCAQHQGTPIPDLPPTGELATDEIVEAHESSSPTNNPFDFNSFVNAIDNNRFNIDGGASASLISGVQSHSRGSSWSATIDTVQRAEWPTEDDARFFFNSGGFIRVSFDHPNGSSPQDDNWRQVFNDIGVVTFTSTTTNVSGTSGTSNNIGFYDLTSSFQRIYDGTDVGSGAYSANDVLVDARSINISGVNGGNGTGVELRITFQDQHTNVFSDSVASGTSVIIDELKADVILNNISSPTYSTQDTF